MRNQRFSDSPIYIAPSQFLVFKILIVILCGTIYVYYDALHCVLHKLSTRKYIVTLQPKYHKRLATFNNFRRHFIFLQRNFLTKLSENVTEFSFATDKIQ